MVSTSNFQHKGREFKSQPGHLFFFPPKSLLSCYATFLSKSGIVNSFYWIIWNVVLLLIKLWHLDDQIEVVLISKRFLPFGKLDLILSVKSKFNYIIAKRSLNFSYLLAWFFCVFQYQQEMKVKYWRLIMSFFIQSMIWVMHIKTYQSSNWSQIKVSST